MKKRRKKEKKLIKKIFTKRNKLIAGFIVLIGLLLIVFVIPEFMNEDSSRIIIGEAGELATFIPLENCVPDCSNQTCDSNSDGCGGVCECPTNTLCNQYTFECDSIS